MTPPECRIIFKPTYSLYNFLFLCLSILFVSCPKIYYYTQTYESSVCQVRNFAVQCQKIISSGFRAAPLMEPCHRFRLFLWEV